MSRTLPTSNPANPTSAERDLALRCIRTLRRAGFVALLAGGCVRDELLGKAPSDYDIATSATPQQLAQLFPRTAHVGAHFGVVLVRETLRQVLPEGEHLLPITIEVATFRTDGTYTDNRRPETVRFSTPREDAQRRDFTVNALFLSPHDPEDRQASHAEGHPLLEGAALHEIPSGCIIDFVGGQADLASRTLRAVGDPHARLSEDHLRALRAVRLSAKLGFAIHHDTKHAITRHAMQLRGVSPERVGDECRAMFAHPSRALAAALLAELGLVPAILGTPDRNAAPRPPALLAACAPAGEPAPVGLALLAWSHSLGVRLLASEAGSPAKQFIAAAREGLCLSNDETSEMTNLCTRLTELSEQWGSAPVARRKRIASAKEFAGALHLFSVLEPVAAQAVAQDVAALSQTFGGLQPPPLLTGDHLIARGHKGGPKFKLVLDSVYDAQLEGAIATPEQALALGESLLAPPGARN